MAGHLLPWILATPDEAIEITKIRSVAGLLSEKKGLIGTRPFRAPHPTISDAGLIGGGSVPRPGEVSLANNGVPYILGGAVLFEKSHMVVQAPAG